MEQNTRRERRDSLAEFNKPTWEERMTQARASKSDKSPNTQSPTTDRIPRTPRPPLPDPNPPVGSPPTRRERTPSPYPGRIPRTPGPPVRPPGRSPLPEPDRSLWSPPARQRTLAEQVAAMYPTHLLAPIPSVEESEVSSSPSTPGPLNEDEGDFFLVQPNPAESPLSSREGSQQPVRIRTRPKYPIDYLPSELLISIMSKLSSTQDWLNCLLVSRGWANCAVELLWHRPLFTKLAKLENIAQSINKERPYWPYADMIRRLNLSSLHEEVNDGTLQSFTACSRIERLTLTQCKSLTDQGVTALVQNNANLLALDVTLVDGLTDITIEALAKSCHRLQGLNVTSCSSIQDVSLVQLADSCKHLKRLKLNKCSLVSDVAIEAFARKCPQLLEIDLHGCEEVTDASVSVLMRCLMHSKGYLRELRLAQCIMLTDACFASLPGDLRCDTLRILDLTACSQLTDYAVERIVEAAPRLRILVLAKCTELTDRAIFAIARLGKNLHDIHLGRCGKITDEALRELIKNCQRIRYIDLAGCVLITDQSVRLLANLPKLRRIGLVKCQQITDHSIQALAAPYGHPQAEARGYRITSSLERVHLSYCTFITVKGISTLLNACPKLTHLSLTGIDEFFSRSDLVKYCREAPSEFNEEQRQVFCVFSGEGVTNLRDHLNELERQRKALIEAAGPDRGGDGALELDPAEYDNIDAMDQDYFDEFNGATDHQISGLLQNSGLNDQHPGHMHPLSPMQIAALQLRHQLGLNGQHGHHVVQGGVTDGNLAVHNSGPVAQSIAAALANGVTSSTGAVADEDEEFEELDE